jgi:hypothetical protein
VPREWRNRIRWLFSQPDKGAADALASARACPMCREPIRLDQPVAFTGEHLHCYASQLASHRRALATRIGKASRGGGAERRLNSRRRVSYRVRLWLHADAGFVDARLHDASAFGVGVTLSSEVPRRVLAVGMPIRVEFYRDVGPALSVAAEVRHVTATTVGLQLTEALPDELIEPDARD